MLKVFFMLALAAVVAGLLYMWRLEMLDRICSVERRLQEAATAEQLKDLARSLRAEFAELIDSRPGRGFAAEARRPGLVDLPPPPGAV